MTRSSIPKSISALKKENSKRSKQHRIVIAMFKADQNIIRPRRNVQSWIHPTNSSENKSELATVENDYNTYKNKFGSEYFPTQNRSILTPYSKSQTKIAAEKHSKFQTVALKKYIQDYCEGTSLHGLRYVGAEDVSLFERIFWIFAFIGAIGFSAFFISNVYDRWVYNPLIVGINPEYQTIYNIPFPALTICNMNQARKGEAEKVKNGNDDNEKWLLEDICNQNQNYTMNNSDIHTTNWEFIKNFILKLSQPCSDLLLQCKWQGFIIDCGEIINSALTDEGVCCTFNRVHNRFMYHNPNKSNYCSVIMVSCAACGCSQTPTNKKLGITFHRTTVADFNITFPLNNIDWTPEEGYPSNANNTTWPFRGQGAGEHLGLTLTIDVAADAYYCSSTSSVGLKLRLHSPVETPMMADYGFFLHPRKEVRVAVRPTMDQASATINKIPIEQRQCYFSVEKELYYYRTYTKMNCELECLSNYTLSQCGCVPFYLPKNVDTNICDKRTEACYLKAKLDMNIELHPAVHCNCLPACNEISYAQDHSLGDISKPELRKGVEQQVEPTNLIILHVFYQTTQFRSYEKSEIFGFTEFLSNSGGLLGLFLGFSFLSAVEIVYHLTLRLWCVYYRKYKEHEKTLVVYPFTR